MDFHGSLTMHALAKQKISSAVLNPIIWISKTDQIWGQSSNWGYKSTLLDKMIYRSAESHGAHCVKETKNKF